MRLRFVAMLFGILGVTLVARGQALVDKVPADALVYIGWQGSDALGPVYEKSNLKKFVDSSAIQQLIDETLPDLIRKQGKADADDMQLAEHFAQMIAKHPTAIYVSGFDAKPDDDAPRPKLALICDAGGDKATLLSLFKKMAAKANSDDENANARVIDEAGLIGIGTGFDEKESILAPSAGSFASSNTFSTAKPHLVKDPAVVICANLELCLKKIDAFVKSGGDDVATARWTHGRDASGIARLKQYVFSGGFSGADWTSQTFTEAPAPRKGVVKLLEPAPIDPALMAKIPVDASSASIMQFDFAALVATARDITAAVDPPSVQQFNRGVGFVSITLGRNLEREILAPLGSQWAMYTSPSLGSMAPTGVVIVNKLDDPKVAKAAWNDLAFALSNTLPKMMQRQGVALDAKLDDKTIAGCTLFSVTIQDSSWVPCFVVKDDYLYIGFDPQVIAKAATAEGGAELKANSNFATLMAGMESPGYMSFGYTDLPATAPLASKIHDSLWAMAIDKAKDQGVTLPEHLFPSVDAMKPLLAPAGSVSWADDKGFYSKEKAPFPGAALAYGYGQGDQVTKAAGTAFFLAASLPAMTNAREAASRVASMSNLRQIGMGCLLYSNENKGGAPPDLGTLLLDEDLTVKVFVSPTSRTTIPNDVLNGTPEQQAAWVNANSDYVYIKPKQGFKAGVNAQDPLAYEKIGVQGKKGVNVLYVDGHVEFVQMNRAVDAIKEATGADPVKLERKKPASPAMP